jgi:hypothetical protein
MQKPKFVETPLGLGNKVIRRQSSFSRRSLLLAAGSLATRFPLKAETRQEKATRLVRESLEALGGEAFLQIRNTVQTGRAYSFYREQLRGLAVMTIYERFEPMREDAGPDWLPVSRREVYSEKGDYYVLFVNGKGWEITFRGARPHDPERMVRYRESTRRNFFYFLRYRLNEPGLYFYHKGVEILNNVPTDAIDISDQQGETITVYLAQSDRLPVEQVYTRRDPKTRIPYEEKSVFSKYRPVGSVKLPWNIRHERDGEKIFELFGATLLVNETLEESLFSLSKDLPVLPEAP